MTAPQHPEVVGPPEIAQRLGVQRTTVDSWRQRPLGFPEPRWTIGGRPAWHWPDVAAWHAKRNKQDGRP